MKPQTQIDEFCERAMESSPLQGAQRAEVRRELASHIYERAAEIAGGPPGAADIERAVAGTDVRAFTHPESRPDPVAWQPVPPAAPRGRRLAAFLLDFLLVAFVSALLAVPFVGPEISLAGYNDIDEGDMRCQGFYAMGVSFLYRAEAPVGEKTPCQRDAQASGVAASFTFVMGLVYFGIMEGARGQSLGKMALGLRAVDAGGRDLSYGQAFGRNVVKGLWALQLIDMLWWFSARRQRLLERWSRSVVVDTRRAGPGGPLEGEPAPVDA